MIIDIIDLMSSWMIFGTSKCGILPAITITGLGEVALHHLSKLLKHHSGTWEGFYTDLCGQIGDGLFIYWIYGLPPRVSTTAPTKVC